MAIMDNLKQNIKEALIEIDKEIEESLKELGVKSIEEGLKKLDEIQHNIKTKS